MKEEYWKMKNGEKIAVGDMSESHVKNVLRMIIRTRNAINDKRFEDQMESWEKEFWDDVYRYGSEEFN